MPEVSKRLVPRSDVEPVPHGAGDVILGDLHSVFKRILERKPGGDCRRERAAGSVRVRADYTRR